MKSPREIKTEKIRKVQGLIDESMAIVLADYKGLPVHRMEELRRKLREAGGQLTIIKNTLARIALEEKGMDDMSGDLGGQIAFVFSKKDAVVGTKVAHEFAKGNDNFKVIAGYFDGRRLTVEEVAELADLPSRDTLQSRLVLYLLAPMQDVVGLLQAPFREFLGTLEARARKLEEAGEVEAA